MDGTFDEYVIAEDEKTAAEQIIKHLSGPVDQPVPAPVDQHTPEVDEAVVALEGEKEAPLINPQDFVLDQEDISIEEQHEKSSIQIEPEEDEIDDDQTTPKTKKKSTATTGASQRKRKPTPRKVVCYEVFFFVSIDNSIYFFRHP